jgi:hypothetical protein
MFRFLEEYSGKTIVSQYFGIEKLQHPNRVLVGIRLIYTEFVLYSLHRCCKSSLTV